jgi:hypothetical protein
MASTAALPRNILIFGGTGVIGQYITSAVLNAKTTIPSLATVTLFTSAGSASDQVKQKRIAQWKTQGLHVVSGDVNSAADVTKAFRSPSDGKGIDTVISALGRGSIAPQKELVTLAEQEESVKWFFPSEFGTDIEYDESSAAERPHQQKLAVRRHIRETTKNLKFTYVVTGPYADMFLGPKGPKSGGFMAEKREAVMVGDGTDRIGFTTMPE